MEDFLSGKAHEYEGLIIRPIEISDNFARGVQLLLKKGKKIVLTDLNLTKQQLQTLYTKELPFFVGSDFSKGGELVAECINKFVSE